MITIDNNYCIKVDEFNYTLCRVRTSKSGKNKGKEYFETVGYYSSLIDALEAYGRENVRAALLDGDMTLTEALTVIKESYEQTARTIKESIPKYRVVEY
jgi:hypothetical protein